MNRRTRHLLDSFRITPYTVNIVILPGATRSKVPTEAVPTVSSYTVAVRSVTAMRTRWRSSSAVVTLRGPVPAHLCLRPSSLH